MQESLHTYSPGQRSPWGRHSLAFGDPASCDRGNQQGEALAIVIHNAAIATVDDGDTVHYDAAIAIEADRIAAIGPNAGILARYPAAERIDGTGKMVLPGFANIHTHLTRERRLMGRREVLEHAARQGHGEV